MVRQFWRAAAVVAVTGMVTVRLAAAAVIPIGSACSVRADATTFNTAPSGAEVNGLVVDGITFQYIATDWP